ncbi:MAG: hypothetical protein AABO58_24700 [Acidobacteriota bacterium]
MTQLVDWIYAAARPWIVFTLLAVALVFTVFFQMKAKSYPPCFSTFDGSWFYTPDAARAKLEALGPKGRNVYRSQEIQLDLVFPLIYGFLLAFALALLAPGTKLPRWIVILPLIAALADYGENFSALAMLGRFERGVSLDGIPWLGSVCTLIKQTISRGSFIVAGALAIAAWLRK